MNQLAQADREGQLDPFPAVPVGKCLWERYCPRPELGDDALLRRLSQALDEPELLAELRRLERAGEYPRPVLERLIELGLMLAFCDDRETPRTTPWHLAALNAINARRSTSLAITIGVNSLALLPTWIGADEQQLKWILGRVREGAFSSMLLTELRHGSNLLRNEVYAEPGRLDVNGEFEPGSEAPTHYRINGEKDLINGGQEHALLFALLRTRPAVEGDDSPLAGRGAHSMFAIERQPGVLGLPRWDTLPAKAADISGVRFENLIVPARTRLAPEGEGFTLAKDTLSMSRGGISALAAGTVAHAREQALSYARQRDVYGGPISTLGGIGDHLIRMEALERVVAAASLRSTVWVNACGLKAAPYTAVAKFASCQLAEEAIDEGRRVLGGRALLGQVPYARLITDVLLYGVFDGTSHVMLEELQVRLTADVRRWRKGADEGRDTVGELRDMLAQAPRRAVEVLRVRNKTRPFCLPLHLRALAALEGETDLRPLAELGQAVYALTHTALEGGVWREDQGLRLQVARTYALLESLTALAELFDPDRRQALGVAPALDQSPHDVASYRFALGWLGHRAVGELTLSAAQGGLDPSWDAALEGGVGALSKRLLTDQAAARVNLLTACS